MPEENPPPQAKATLGLTGLTINAMALIAPGAFLWLTYAMQSQYGAPMAGSGMWFGIVVALALCFATAIAYAELSKLYPDWEAFQTVRRHLDPQGKMLNPYLRELFGA